MHPTYTQLEQRNPTLVMYKNALHIATENGPEITNVATPHHSKRNCIILLDTLDNEKYPKLSQKKQHATKKQEEQDRSPLSNETNTA